MLKRKTKQDNLSQQDVALLLQSMDNIIAGDLSEISTAEFHQPELANKLNAVINALKIQNNPVVMRLNDAMETIGDNTLIKDTMDQVEAQTQSIQNMETTSENLESSISYISNAMGQIRTNTHEILSSSQSITDSMSESMEAVNQSSGQIQSINAHVQDFKSRIEKISEIVNLVKTVATQSNLLALNASIEAARAGEAGRGFAVVADQVRQMAIDTSNATQDIVNYVELLKSDIDTLAESMNETTTNLEHSNIKVESSLQAMTQMNEQMDAIKYQVDNVFDAIDTQMEVTKDFTKQIEGFSESYQKLSEACIQSGKHIFQVGRYLDKTRSDLVRGCSAITPQDWLRVFEVDHYIFTWRIYNNIVGFEHLDQNQVVNSNGCKLGKWLQSQTDKALTQSSEYQQLMNAHNDLHKCAAKSWSANEEGSTQTALSYFQQTYDAFLVYDKAIKALQSRMRSLGYTDETQIVSFH